VIRGVNVQRSLVDVDPCNRVELNTELFRDQPDTLGESARRAEQINEPNLNVWAVTAAIDNRCAADTLKKPCRRQIIVKGRRGIRQRKHGRCSAPTDFNLSNQPVAIAPNGSSDGWPKEPMKADLAHSVTLRPKL
jgi:hypothetical protein